MVISVTGNTAHIRIYIRVEQIKLNSATMDGTGQHYSHTGLEMTIQMGMLHNV